MPLSPDQIAALVDQHAAALEVWIGRSSRDPEDVVQEAFCRLAVMDPPPDRPGAWLYRVARNLAANERLFRRRRTRREQRVASPEPYLSDPAERLFAADAVGAVLRLDAELREVVVARIWGQLTFEEIGQLSGISTATASRRYSTAIEELRKKLGMSCPVSNR